MDARAEALDSVVASLDDVAQDRSTRRAAPCALAHGAGAGARRI